LFLHPHWEFPMLDWFLILSEQRHC
jgi:hypothetical protein